MYNEYVKRMKERKLAPRSFEEFEKKLVKEELKTQFKKLNSS